MTLYFDCLLTFLNLCSKVRRSNLTLTVFSCQGCRCGCDMKKCRNQPFLHPWRKCLPQSWTSCNLIVIKVFLSSASAQIFRSSLSVTCFSFIPKRPLRISTPLFTEESKRKRCLRSRSGRNQDAEGWTPYLALCGGHSRPFTPRPIPPGTPRPAHDLWRCAHLHSLPWWQSKVKGHAEVKRISNLYVFIPST